LIGIAAHRPAPIPQTDFEADTRAYRSLDQVFQVSDQIVEVYAPSCSNRHHG
jgi:hypothetical protein